MIEFDKKTVGNFGEKWCEKYVKKKKKYKILSRNKTLGHLEADIIAYNKDYIIFIEVKTRRTDKNNLTRPADAVNYDKRTNLIKFAYAFVKTLPQKFKEKTPRIDVCEVYVLAEAKKLKVCDFNYIENAVTK
ncbi:MAG: YraN family protein [Ruminococcaceae bacterium]|nr:YraN family protein [Oscillospiraceae bacterium]